MRQLVFVFLMFGWQSAHAAIYPEALFNCGMGFMTKFKNGHGHLGSKMKDLSPNVLVVRAESGFYSLTKGFGTRFHEILPTTPTIAPDHYLFSIVDQVTGKKVFFNYDSSIYPLDEYAVNKPFTKIPGLPTGEADLLDVVVKLRAAMSRVPPMVEDLKRLSISDEDILTGLNGIVCHCRRVIELQRDIESLLRSASVAPFADQVSCEKFPGS